MKRLIFFGALALASITLAASADAEYAGTDTRTMLANQFQMITKSIGNAQAMIGGKKSSAAAPDERQSQSAVNPPANATPSISATPEDMQDKILPAITDSALPALGNATADPVDLSHASTQTASPSAMLPLTNASSLTPQNVQQIAAAKPETPEAGKPRSIEASVKQLIPMDIPGPAVTILFAVATIVLLRRFG